MSCVQSVLCGDRPQAKPFLALLCNSSRACNFTLSDSSSFLADLIQLLPRAACVQEGGNAMDAAIATCLCQGVTNPFASGIGGGFFMTVRSADGSRAEFIDAREYAPAAATWDMFNGAQWVVFFHRPLLQLFAIVSNQLVGNGPGFCRCDFWMPAERVVQYIRLCCALPLLATL
jgi:hypothetical protein